MMCERCGIFSEGALGWSYHRQKAMHCVYQVLWFPSAIGRCQTGFQFLTHHLLSEQRVLSSPRFTLQDTSRVTASASLYQYSSSSFFCMGTSFSPGKQAAGSAKPQKYPQYSLQGQANANTHSLSSFNPLNFPKTKITLNSIITCRKAEVGWRGAGLIPEWRNFDIGRATILLSHLPLSLISSQTPNSPSLPIFILTQSSPIQYNKMAFSSIPILDLSL